MFQRVEAHCNPTHSQLSHARVGLVWQGLDRLDYRLGRVYQAIHLGGNPKEFYQQGFRTLHRDLMLSALCRLRVLAHVVRVPTYVLVSVHVYT